MAEKKDRKPILKIKFKGTYDDETKGIFLLSLGSIIFLIVMVYCIYFGNYYGAIVALLLTLMFLFLPLVQGFFISRRWLELYQDRLVLYNIKKSSLPEYSFIIVKLKEIALIEFDDFNACQMTINPKGERFSNNLKSFTVLIDGITKSDLNLIFTKFKENGIKIKHTHSER